MTRCVEVTTPGRLHFGLASFGGAGRQYRGLGLMVDGAGVSVRITESPAFQVSGPLRERIEKFVSGYCAYCTDQHSVSLPKCRIEASSVFPEHSGLGVGTQLGLAVVAGLAEWHAAEWRDPQQLCAMSGRGLRSAVGTHGFLHGGLLADGGKMPEETLGALQQRVDFPKDWRVVLIRPIDEQGLSGGAEADAIAGLPAVPKEITQQLQNLITDRLLPAAQHGDYAVFGESLYTYGRLAGECFAPIQGGPFASPTIASLVATIRQRGIAGVGQSSWGPTVFAVTANERLAEKLVEQLQCSNIFPSSQIAITKANNTGALVQSR